MRSAAQSRKTPPLKSISPIEKPKSRKFRQAPSPSSLRLFTPAAFRHRWQKNSRVPICRVSRSSPLPCTADAPMKTLLSNSTICAKKQKLRFWPAPRRLLRMFLCPIWSAAVPTKTTVVVPGNRPYRPAYKAAFVPETDTAMCRKCGVCIAACPTGAIDAQDPSKTDINLCINCMRCVASCASGAKAQPAAAKAAITARLSPLLGGHKPNEFYL